ncbi:ATP-binding protein [Microbulbifer sp. TYP-18]|uniref:ATP-binding protein n=1 Tax=Microbulbifer sp. TYP-18 TaxID=3230024 RepID=UPI0034C61460
MKLRRQLTLVSLAALALPWAGCQYLRQVDDALAAGQMQALKATANAVAARLASAPQLIAPDSGRLGRPDGAQLYLHPLPHSPRLDGYGDEWRSWGLPPQPITATDGTASAQVTLGRSGEQVYLLLTVADETHRYHDPRTGLPASGDTVELSMDGQRYLLPVASQGPVRALRHRPRRGDYQRELRLRGRWTSGPDGYQLELAIPYALTAGELAITALDRHNSDGGPPARIASTLPADGVPGRLVEPLPQLESEIHHFARPHLRLAVVDREGFLLASSGSLDPGPTPSQNQHWLRRWVTRSLLAREPLQRLPAGALPEALSLNRTTTGQWFAGDSAERVGAASVPVITRADDIVERPLLGRVIAMQSGAAMQSLTDSAARQLWLITCATAGAALLILLGYANWLSWRIRRLHRAAGNAVDASGKLRGNFPPARLNDELGALNRAFAKLLAELDHYHQYLRTLAGKLSHELRTPLAVVRSSLDNLHAGELDEPGRRYAQRAMEGGERLSGILNSLAAASNLEASIQQAEREEFDLGDLLDVLSQSYRDAKPSHRFSLTRPPGNLHYYGAPELLAQLMDKLVDNACSFAPANSEIRLTVTSERAGYAISVDNDGPPLPAGYDQKLFDSLVSVRSGGGREGHLGLGLHIARLIAEFHQGCLQARNREDGSGVVFTLFLPVD